MNTEGAMAAFVLLSLRAFGAIALLPFGEGANAILSRLVIALGCAFALTPELLAAPVTPGSIIGNLFVGIVLSLPIVCVLEGAAMAGELIDVARGQTIAQVYDPLQNEVTSPLGVAGRHLAWVTLIVLAAETVLLGSLKESLTLLPLESPLDLFNRESGWGLLEQCATILASCVRLILPLIVLFFLIECVFGVVAKFATKTSLQVESSAAKIAAGSVLLLTIVSSGSLESLFPMLRLKLD